MQSVLTLRSAQGHLCYSDEVNSELRAQTHTLIKEGRLDEQTQRYREIRQVFTHLVANMPGVPDRTWPGTALQAARAYLHGHCAECGATLERHDYALVHAQEMVRIGTTTASDIGNLPICPECYVERCVVRQQFAPVDKPKRDQ
jgi:hypothetical protein